MLLNNKIIIIMFYMQKVRPQFAVSLICIEICFFFQILGTLHYSFNFKLFKMPVIEKNPQNCYILFDQNLCKCI